MRSSGSAKPQPTVFSELFPEVAEDRSGKALSHLIAQLSNGRKRVRRLLDRGALRNQGAAMKKATTAFLMAQEVLEKLAREHKG